MRMNGVLNYGDERLGYVQGYGAGVGASMEYPSPSPLFAQKLWMQGVSVCAGAKYLHRRELRVNI
jgi:hypothetical protein